MKSLVLLLSLLLASVASADILITLTDGSTVQGSFKHTDDGYLVTKADGTQQLVPDNQVKITKVVSASSAATPGMGNASLESLRHATANIDDLNVIIKRYQAFITQNATSPAAKDAQQDLATWQDRADKKMVKAGGNWVTPEELEKLKSLATATAARVAPMISAGKLAEASKEVDRALAVAPSNADLQYLKGIIAYKQAQLAPAKNAFQAAGQAAPSHGPSHNNAAVALAKVHDPMPALAEFEKAMESMPNNQTILDNVAETLHALPVAHQTKPLTKRVVELFQQQDANLQRTMATQGKFRWGSDWIDQAQYAVVQAQKKEQQDKLDAIKKDYDGDKLRISQLEQRITSDGVQMQQMLQYNVTTNAQGQQVQLPPPPQYAMLQRDQLSCQSERDAKVIELRQLERNYNQQSQLVIAGTYKGTLTIFEADALPSAPPPAATQPAAPATGQQLAQPPAIAPKPGAPGQSMPPKPKGTGDY